MIITCYIVLNALFQANRFTATSALSNTGTEFYEMAKVVLELQTKYCDYIPLCTVNASAYNKHRHSHGECCQPCSCKTDCKYSYTCCPDFWVRDVIPDIIFEDADDLLDTLRNKSIKDVLELSSVVEAAYVKETILQSEECVSAQLFTKQNIRGSFANRDAYLMLSKCPNDYGKKHNEFRIKELCDSPADIGHPEYVDLSAETLIPISSSKSGITYKNMFCLECNEGTREGMPWSSWLSIRRNKRISDPILFSESALIFREINRRQFFNIVFQPPKFTEDLIIRKCNFAHVKTCQKDWIGAHNDTYMVALYENTCKNFFSPVVGEKGTTRTIFNNIVCKRCNTMNDDAPCVSNRNVKEFRLELNTNAITTSTGTSSNTSSKAGSVPLDMLTNDASMCNKGYMFDNTDKTCRMIYCPRNFFNDKGQCVPTILHVSGFYYSLKLVVTPGSNTSLNDTSEMIEFETKLNEFLELILQDNFEDFAMKLWRQFVNKILENHLIYISFRNDNDTYADSLDLILALLHSVSTFSVQINERIIPINVRFLRYDIFSISTLSRDASDVIDQFDISKKRSLELVYNTGTKEEFTLMSNLEVSRSHICFRVILDRYEVHVYGKGLARIKRTNVTIHGPDFDITYDVRGLYVCIKDFLNVDLKFRSRREMTFLTAVDSSEKLYDDITLLAVIISALGVGMLGLLIGFVCKIVKKRGHT